MNLNLTDSFCSGYSEKDCKGEKFCSKGDSSAEFGKCIGVEGLYAKAEIIGSASSVAFSGLFIAVAALVALAF